MKASSLIALFLIFFARVAAQKEGNIWYFGNNAGVDFNSGTAVAITNGAMSTTEGCSSICDSLGALLFYTDGTKIWNRNHVLMANGSGLTGNTTSTQSGLIVKQPGNANLYYVFTNFSTLNYSVVDMTMNSGLGDVTAVKNVLLMTGSEKMCATRHANGTDVWLIMHENFANGFNAFLLTSTGINSTPVHSADGFAPSNAPGQMKCSPIGDKIALGIQATNTIQISSFDNSTGIVSGSFPLTTNTNQTYGIEFSPSGKFLYATANYNVYTTHQFNLTLGTPAAILASRIQIGSSVSYDAGGMQLAPDGKIYLAPYSSGYLDAITYPDSAGLACGYVHNILYLSGKICQLGLPEYVSNIFKPKSLQASYTSTTQLCHGVCNGSATTSPTGGTPPYQYFWQPNNDTAASVTNLCAGIYTALVVDAGNDSVQVSFTIPEQNAITAVVTADSTTCGNSNGTATALALGGAGSFTYVWNNGDSTAAIGNLAAGTYTVTASDITGCSATAGAVVNASGSGTVAITADKGIMCAGDSTFICAPANYVSYLWNGGQTTQCIYAKTAGNYYVTATDANNCQAVSNHLPVQVYPLPSISISVNGNELTCFDGLSYQWYLNNVIIPNATQNTLLADQGGNYSVAITDLNGCRVVSNSVLVLTGIHDLLQENQMNVYPNPLESGSWTLECDHNLIGSRAEIFDNNSRLIYSSEVKTEKTEINLTAERGIYLMRISSERGVIIRKLIKL